MIVLMFALLLVLGTGAGMMASISSRSAIKETKNEQAYIAARSVALAIKDEIVSRPPTDDLVNNLLGASALSSDYLPGTSYQLDVTTEAVDSTTNQLTFTVAATYEGATEQYSFKIFESASYSPATSPVTDLFYSAFWTQNSFDAEIPADVTILGSLDLKGDFVGERIRTGGNFLASTGHVTVDGAIIALGTAENKVPVGGDIYAKGNVYVNNTINGNIYTEGNVLVKDTVNGNVYAKGTVTMQAKGNVTGSIDQHASAMPQSYIDEITSLENAVYMMGEDGGMIKMDFEDLPKPFTYDNTLLNLAKNSGGLTAANSVVTSDSILITDHASVGGGDLSDNGKIKKVTIDATSSDPNVEKVIYVYVDETLNIMQPTVIETIGHVVFVLKENVDFVFTNNTSLYTSNINDGNLKTYIYGLYNNTIDFKGVDLNAYIYIEGDGGLLDISTGINQLAGFAQVATVKINGEISTIVFKTPGTDDDGSGESVYTKIFKYVGVSS
jgi:cytoskeletal protein CcmA (bactofilin family)